MKCKIVTSIDETEIILCFLWFVSIRAWRVIYHEPLSDTLIELFNNLLIMNNIIFVAVCIPRDVLDELPLISIDAAFLVTIY
jgi:hypothetical protein